MNANRLINMGIRYAMKFLTQRAAASAKTPEEKARVKKGAQTARQVHKATRLAQRLGKM